jgi:HEAT repeat protein
MSNPSAIDALARALRTDSANQVRIAAADALGSIGGPRVVSILAPFVEADDRDLSSAALAALGNIGHPDALQPIVSVLRSKDATARANAVRAVASRRDALAVEALQWTSAVDSEPAVSAAAIRELGAMATDASIAALIRLSADRRLRDDAIAALVRLDPSHIDRVALGLKNPEMEVRRAVVEALGRMKHPTASHVLAAALDDERPEVRLAAVIAFRRLGSRSAERKLLLLSHNDPDPGIRKAAETALER